MHHDGATEGPLGWGQVAKIGHVLIKFTRYLGNQGLGQSEKKADIELFDWLAQKLPRNKLCRVPERASPMLFNILFDVSIPQNDGPLSWQEFNSSLFCILKPI